MAKKTAPVEEVVFDVEEFYRFCDDLEVETKELGIVSLGATMLESQRYFIDEVAEGLARGIHYFVVLKGRQLGITTICLALDLYWHFKHPGTQGTLATDTEENREMFRSTLQMYMESLPMKWRQPVTSHNRTQIVLGNRSRMVYQVAGTRKNVGFGAGKALSFMHACAAPGTPVIVDDGRIRLIEDVKIGDKVLTHTGAVTSVIDVFGQKNDKGALVKIHPWLGHPLAFTGEHTIPTERGIVEAKDVTENDWLVMPVRKITQTVFGDVLPSTPVRLQGAGIQSAGSGMRVEFTEEFGYACGYYLAEGNVNHRSTDGRPSGINFARHRDEVAYADRARNAIKPFMSSRNTRDKNDCLTTIEECYGSSFAMWIKSTFGPVDSKIIPDDVFEWGEDFCRGLLCGLLCGDGSKKQTHSGKYVAPRMTLSTIRASFAMQARDIASALGYGWAACRYEKAAVKHGRNCKAQWRIVWSGDAARKLRALIGLDGGNGGRKSSQRYRIENGLVYLKVKKIERDIQCDEVWDISVEHDDHTFRTPYMAIGNTETGKWGEGTDLSSLEASLAQSNPKRFYVFESTAYGFNMFNEMWETALTATTQKAIFIGWWRNRMYRVRENDLDEVRREIFKVYWDGELTEGERKWVDAVKELYDYDIHQEQIAWWRWTLNETMKGDENQMFEKYPPIADYAFVATGSNFFSTQRLSDMMKVSKKKAHTMHRFVFGGAFEDTQLIDCNERTVTLKIWETPQMRGQYVIGADPAWGSSTWADGFAINVSRVWADGIEQAAEFCTKDLNTMQFAWVLLYMAAAYGDRNVGANVMINLEINGPGRAVWNEIQTLKQRAGMTGGDANVAYILANIQNYLYRRPDAVKGGLSYHTLTTNAEKERMLSLMKDNHELGTLVINSFDTLDEMKNVQREGGMIGAPGRGKDDRVIAQALAVLAWCDWIRIRLVQARITRESQRQEASMPESYQKAGRNITNYLQHIGLRPKVTPLPPQLPNQRVH